MGPSVARPATGVMDFVEVTERTPCAIFVLDMFKNVIVECRATTEQDGKQAVRHVRGPVQPRTTDKHQRRQLTMSHRVRISPRR